MRILPTRLAAALAFLGAFGGLGAFGRAVHPQAEPPPTPDQVAERGDPKGIHWHGDVKAALEEAQERNCPILVAFIAENRGDQVVVEGLYRDPATIALTRRFVCLVAGRGRHDLVRDFAWDGRMRNVCGRFGSVACSEHQRVERWAFPRFSEKNAIVTPQHIFLDAGGKELGRVVNDLNVTAEMFHAEMQKAIERVGPGVSAADHRRLQRELRDAARWSEAGDHRRAIAALLAIEKAAGRSRIGVRARALLERAEQAAVVELKALDVLIASGDFAGARELAAASALRFEGLTTAKIFQDRLDLLKGRGSGSEPKAARLLQQAEAAFEAKRYAEAEDLYRRLVKHYGTTRAATVATARLESFRTDPDLARALAAARAEADCRAWMRMGDALRASGRRDAAREYYERVVATYPGSSFAAAARARLARL